MRIRFGTMVTMLITLCVLGGADLFAQRWQNLHGHPNFFEYGRYGVQPVTVGGGYIAVGTTYSPAGGTSADVYVVRVNACGIPIWQTTYDINGMGSYDIGNCIVECQFNPTISGTRDFAITGYTTDTLDCSTGGGLATANTDVFFLRIDAVGNVVCANTYGWNNRLEGGEYIRECRFGNTVYGTLPGDLVISGFCQDTSRDAYLLRVRRCGALVWDGIYGGSGTDYFQGCLESQFGPATSAGEIVAVGGSDSYSAGVMNGFAVRVNGGNGLVVNAGTYGQGVFTRFWTVEELSITNTITPPVFPGQLVMVGGKMVTNSAGVTSMEFYAVRTTPNVCLPIVHITHGDFGAATDEYSTVKEIRGAPATSLFGPRNGHLVVTGHTYAPYGVNDEAILHELFPGNLMIVPVGLGGAGYKIYGNATESQGGWSVNPVIFPAACPTVAPSQGFVICGYWNPYATPTNTDPGQLYLIKTNAVGDAGGTATAPCFWRDFQSTWTGPPLDTNCIWPWKGQIMRECVVSPIRASLPYWVRLCFFNPKEAMAGEESGEIAEAYLYPNPITRGTAMTVRYGVPEAENVTITVADMTGRTVFTASHESTKGANELALTTDDLPAGTYIVTVRAEGVDTSQKFVVNEK